MATKKKAKKVAAAPKKKGNPRITNPSKVADAESKKRSKAAKKGWATRRRNAVKKRASNNQRKLKNVGKALPKSKPVANPRISTKGKTKKELQAIVRAQEKQLKAAEKEIARVMRTDDWVDAVDQEYLSREGHIALKPSKARWDADFFMMQARLNRAHEMGEDAFEDEVYDMAAEYDYEVREIYTLFFSP